jgi:hypothetical protein
MNSHDNSLPRVNELTTRTQRTEEAIKLCVVLPFVCEPVNDCLASDVVKLDRSRSTLPQAIPGIPSRKEADAYATYLGQQIGALHTEFMHTRDLLCALLVVMTIYFSTRILLSRNAGYGIYTMQPCCSVEQAAGRVCQLHQQRHAYL